LWEPPSSKVDSEEQGELHLGQYPRVGFIHNPLISSPFFPNTACENTLPESSQMIIDLKGGKKNY